MNVYSVEFSPCIYESDFSCISLHVTKYGAVAAMASHKRKHNENMLCNSLSSMCREDQEALEVRRIDDYERGCERWRYRKIEVML